MKKSEVIMGVVIAMVVLIATLIVHYYIVKLSHILMTCFVMFSVLWFALCLIGDKKRREREESQKSDE